MEICQSGTTDAATTVSEVLTQASDTIAEAVDAAGGRLLGRPDEPVVVCDEAQFVRLVPDRQLHARGRQVADADEEDVAMAEGLWAPFAVATVWPKSQPPPGGSFLKPGARVVLYAAERFCDVAATCDASLDGLADCSLAHELAHHVDGVTDAEPDPLGARWARWAELNAQDRAWKALAHLPSAARRRRAADAMHALATIQPRVYRDYKSQPVVKASDLPTPPPSGATPVVPAMLTWDSIDPYAPLKLWSDSVPTLDPGTEVWLAAASMEVLLDAIRNGDYPEGENPDTLQERKAGGQRMLGPLRVVRQEGEGLWVAALLDQPASWWLYNFDADAGAAKITAPVVLAELDPARVVPHPDAPVVWSQRGS